MKKFPLLFVTIVAASCYARTGQAAGKHVPDSAFRGNWIDTTTNLWTLSLWDGFAVVDASFWDYGKWNGNDKAATALLTRTDGTSRKLRFALLNDTTLIMRDGKRQHILLHESPAVAARPFTASGRDTTSFRSMPWVNDSIRIEGFITGYKPGGPVWSYESVPLFGLYADRLRLPLKLDSLGRFRLTLPATHPHLYIVGNYLAAEPGDRIFIAFSEKERNLFMGDNARVNQEIDAHNPFMLRNRYLPTPDMAARAGTSMSWRFGRIAARDMALAAIDRYGEKHNLSRKAQQIYHGVIKQQTILEISAMPYKQTEPMTFPYAYFSSGNGLDYADPELYLGRNNDLLFYPFLSIWRTYETPYVIRQAGLSGKDAETFSMGDWLRSADPARFRDFWNRHGQRIDSVYRTITPVTRLLWTIPIMDTLLPQSGLNHDIALAQNMAITWSSGEDPLPDEVFAQIDSSLGSQPFLRDTLRGLNEHYRLLAERNASLEIPMGTVDSTLMRPDSILAAILRPYKGEAACMIFVQPGDASADKELRHIPTIREKYKDAALRFILVSEGLAPLKWRNTIAEYGLMGEHTVHYELTSPQLQALLRKYWNGSGFFLLFDRTGEMAASPVPKPSEGDKLLQKIDELLAR